MSCCPVPSAIRAIWRAAGPPTATTSRRCFATITWRAPSSTGCSRARSRFFTDKMPFNEIHLPLLKMAFPGARIVRVVRHPLDVCVSMLANNMTHGFACAYRIEDITHHLAAVFDLVEHYARESDPDAYTLRYESLIADQCGETRAAAGVSGAAVRGGLPALSQESPLRAHPELRAGHRAAQRQRPEPAPALRAAAATLRVTAGADDDEIRLPLSGAPRLAAQRPRSFAVRLRLQKLNFTPA